jgi:AmiR/NasT family two-component response regulator
VDGDVFKLLEQSAAKRRITINKLASEILTTVALEEMVDAVLDDGVTA